MSLDDDAFVDLPVKVKRGEMEYEILPQQLSTETLRWIFGVSPEGVREEFSGRVHFPNSNGNFDLSSTFSSNSLVVEGPLAVSSPSMTVSSTPGPVTSVQIVCVKDILLFLILQVLNFGRHHEGRSTQSQNLT